MTGKVPLVQLIDIHKRYGQGEAAFFALQGIDFEIEEGDFVAVMKEEPAFCSHKRRWN